MSQSHVESGRAHSSSNVDGDDDDASPPHAADTTTVQDSNTEQDSTSTTEQDSASSTPSAHSQASDQKSQAAHSQAAQTSSSTSPWTRIPRRLLDVVTYQPPGVRWDPERPPKFTLGLNVLFAFAGAFTVANLYYSHPILNVLARDFGVSDEKSSQIPTLAQVGYATGLIFINPLGDIFRRRALTLGLIWLTATLWIGLCVTRSFVAFSVLTFLTGVTTVTPQIMVPLVGDLAPPNRRAAAISIVGSGNLLGILVARLLSGIVANYTSWRNIYWVAFGMQYCILALLWFNMPDYPATNSPLNYFSMLWSMVGMLRKHPVLVQACLLTLCSSAPFTSYWTTLTFLLAGEYGYSPLPIGLWALIGIAGILITPLFARRVIDAFVPLFSTVLGEALALTGVIVGTYTGLHSVAGPAIQAFFLDVGLGTTQNANRSSIYSCEPAARNRINTVYMLATFFGQITGTAAGNRLYAQGGWIASGSLSVALLGFGLLTCAARGPWQGDKWFGWSGGWSVTKKEKMSGNGIIVETALHTRRVETAVEKVDKSRDASRGEDDAVRRVEVADLEKGEQVVDGHGGKDAREGV